MEVRILGIYEAEIIATALQNAGTKTIFVGWDEDGFKIKLGNGTWSPPFGITQEAYTHRWNDETE